MEYVILYCVCAICILGGIGNYLYYKLKEKKYYKVTGTIIDYQVSEDEGGNLRTRPYLLYSPIVEYVDKNGITQNIVSEDSNPYVPMYRVGTAVTFFVNPDDSTRILFDNASDKFLIPIVFISIGVVGIFFVHFLSKQG